MNLPNKLTLLRVVLVPFSMFFVVFPHIFGESVAAEVWARLLAAAIFGITALTDMFDGKIARKYNLITNFGKFMDPLADKFMVFGMLVALCGSGLFAWARQALVFVTVLVILRELAVTSMRLLAASSSENVVIAANWLGKVKTTAQIGFILCMLLEAPLILLLQKIGLQIPDYHILSYLSMVFMTFMTVYSGLSYLMSYRRYIDFSH